MLGDQLKYRKKGCCALKVCSHHISIPRLSLCSHEQIQIKCSWKWRCETYSPLPHMLDIEKKRKILPQLTLTHQSSSYMERYLAPLIFPLISLMSSRSNRGWINCDMGWTPLLPQLLLQEMGDIKVKAYFSLGHRIEQGTFKFHMNLNAEGYLRYCLLR